MYSRMNCTGVRCDRIYTLTSGDKCLNFLFVYKHRDNLTASRRGDWLLLWVDRSSSLLFPRTKYIDLIQPSWQAVPSSVRVLEAVYGRNTTVHCTGLSLSLPPSVSPPQLLPLLLPCSTTYRHSQLIPVFTACIYLSACCCVPTCCCTCLQLLLPPVDLHYRDMGERQGEGEGGQGHRTNSKLVY